MMRKSVVLNAQGSRNWIGGLYYVKNIAFQLSQNKNLMDKYRLVVFVSSKNYSVFCDLPSNIVVQKMDDSVGVIGKIKKVLMYKKNNAVFVFPFAKGSKLIGLKSISWIPDFQHYHYPENFSKEDLERRRRQEMEILELEIPLVLSSNDCRKD